MVNHCAFGEAKNMPELVRLQNTFRRCPESGATKSMMGKTGLAPIEENALVRELREE
jgi:hypothetical protein